MRFVVAMSVMKNFQYFAQRSFYQSLSRNLFDTSWRKKQKFTDHFV